MRLDFPFEILKLFPPIFSLTPPLAQNISSKRDRMIENMFRRCLKLRRTSEVNMGVGVGDFYQTFIITTKNNLFFKSKNGKGKRSIKRRL